MKPPLETVEQQHIILLTRSLGGAEYVLGTKRPRGDYPGTRQTPGLPDLFLFLPRIRAVDGVGLWWEVKRSGGTRTPEQVGFGEHCAMTNQAYGWGDCNAFIAYLIRAGRLRPDQVAHYRVPA